MTSTQKVKVVVLLGAPGSGKGTQAKRLVEKHANWVHISTGDLFRKEIASHSTLGNKLSAILAAGQLVDDKLTCEVFESQVEQILKNKADTALLLLDGFPRTEPQAEALLEFCQKTEKLNPPSTVEFLVDEESLIGRLSGRLVNPRTGRVYHLVLNPPRKAGFCDEDGGPLIQRTDDKPEVIRERFKIYQGQRDAIVGVLGRIVAPERLDADSSPEKVTLELESLLAK